MAERDESRQAAFATPTDVVTGIGLAREILDRINTDAAPLELDETQQWLLAATIEALQERLADESQDAINDRKRPRVLGPFPPVDLGVRRAPASGEVLPPNQRASWARRKIPGIDK